MTGVGGIESICTSLPFFARQFCYLLPPSTPPVLFITFLPHSALGTAPAIQTKEAASVNQGMDPVDARAAARAPSAPLASIVPSRILAVGDMAFAALRMAHAPAPLVTVGATAKSSALGMALAAPSRSLAFARGDTRAQVAPFHPLRQMQTRGAPPSPSVVRSL